MWDYVILFGSNCAVLVCRSFEIRAVAANKPLLAALSQVVLTTMWLISVRVGLDAVLRGDYMMWASYILAAMAGSFWGTQYKRSAAKVNLDLVAEQLALEMRMTEGKHEPTK